MTDHVGVSQPAAMARGLSAADFTRIAKNGFGDPQNTYVHSMAIFRGDVFAGTSRHSMALLKLFPPVDAPAMDPWPVQVPASVQDLDLRGQIWRWEPAHERWTQVQRSPQIPGRNRLPVPRDLGYRGMAVFQGASDLEPALYVGAISTVLRGTAARLLRSEDGQTFTPVSEPGLGNPQVSTFRSMAAFDNHLFVPPAGEGTSLNSNRASVILRSADPVRRRWEVACAPGLGDPTNSGIFELAVFDGHLYAGTFNHYRGYQVWKTPPTGAAPCQWTKVLKDGAFRGPLNEIAMSMCPFDGALYIGSAIQNGGYDRSNLVGPASGEIVRVYPDGSWDLVVGTPRRTPDGVKQPISGMGPGFDNLFAGYIWRMAVHEGWLYASTFDWSVFLPYARRPSAQAHRLTAALGAEEVVAREGGFDLWRTRDGVNWTPVTRNGLGNPYNYGARTLVSTPGGLFLGTANPFAPKVAARTSGGWTYVANPHGGAEVWIGGPPPIATGNGAGRSAAPQTGAHRVTVATSKPARSANIQLQATPRSRRGGSRNAPEILLTGAAGFVGLALLPRLLTGGQRVRAFDLPDRVGRLAGDDCLEILPGSLTDESALREAARGIELVYHLAALLPGSSRMDLEEINIRGTENLLRACGGAGGVRRFVFLSSLSVYAGRLSPRLWPLAEDSSLGPRGPRALRDYGWSKIASEELVRWLSEYFGFDYVILRSSASYGPGSDFSETLVRAALADPWAGRARQGWLPRQLIHVDDLADVIVRAGTQDDVANETFNVAGVEAHTDQDLARLVRRAANGVDPVTVLPDRGRSWRRYLVPFDLTKAQQRLGFMPRVSMHDGIAELVEGLGMQAERISREI